MRSRRVPDSLRPNDWTRRLAFRQLTGLGITDLTAANPTILGLSPLAEAGAAIGAVAGRPHDPHAFGAGAPRAAVAAMLASRGARLESDEVVLTTGTAEGCAHLFRLLANPGEPVALPAPGYPLLEPLARAEGLEPRAYRLAFDGAWHLDRDSLVRAAEDAKAIVVVEPNNPTGSWLDHADRRFVLEVASGEGAAVIADEVFADHPWHGVVPPRSWLAEDGPVTIFALGGLSKLCGLPQLKLGWIAAAGPEKARREALSGLEWIADLFLSVGGPVQAALPELLTLRHDFLARTRERVAGNLASIDALLLERPELSRLPGDGGWSAVLRVPAWRSAEQWALALLDRGVALHPGDFYDLEGGEYLVVSLVAAPDDVRAGCEAIAAVLHETPGPRRRRG